MASPNTYPPAQVHITTNSPSGSTSTFLPSTTHPNPSTPVSPSTQLTYIYSTPPSFVINSPSNNDLSHSITQSSSQYFFPVEGATGCVIMDFLPRVEGEGAFMHKTDTVDYVVILEGSMELELSEGVKRVVGRGEVVVQRGCWHSWRNASTTESARFLAVAVGEKGAVQGKMHVLGGDEE